MCRHLGRGAVRSTKAHSAAQAIRSTANRPIDWRAPLASMIYDPGEPLLHGVPSVERPRTKFQVFTFVHPDGTEFPAAVFLALRSRRATSVIGRDYFVESGGDAVLIEKAADLKSQVDKSSTTPDPSTQAPDVEPRRVPEP